MNFLYPKFSLKNFRDILGMACIGAAISGTYGMIHDQITYIHNGGYLGALIGLVIAATKLALRVRTTAISNHL